MRVHLYDDCVGVLYLASGRTISINPRQFCSVIEAQEVITDWAKRLGIIGQNDTISAYS
ncbi:hypothetical protein [Vibrio mytili]|uniref:hypothetical protein n=1 Tax=Vibrio mytili TaxID=50718 RepID=UPI000A865C4E|nr:hypothetical protein [Vibrio mytili]